MSNHSSHTHEGLVIFNTILLVAVLSLCAYNTYKIKNLDNSNNSNNPGND
jgi:hypothetical protein